MSNLSVVELQAALLAAQKAERTVSKPMRFKQIIPDYDPASEALAAALVYKEELIDAVNEIDNQLVALADAGNVKFKAIVNRVNALNERIPDADEKEYQELLAQIASDKSDAEMLKLTDYRQDYRFGSLKQERNAAVSALSAHIQIIEALEIV